MESSAIPPFEQQWQSAFQGAEASLPSNAWSGIEHALTRMENESNRRTVVYYQRLAAALLLLAIASASLFVWQWTNVEMNQQSATNEGTQSAEQPGASTASPESQQSHELSMPVSGKRKSTIPIKKEKGLVVQVPQPSHEEKQMVILENEQEQIAMTNEEVGLKGNVTEEKSKPLTQEEEKELVKKLLGEDETIIPEKKATYNKSLWGAVGIAGGSYSPDAANSSAFALSNATAFPNQSAIGQSTANKQSSVGTSYSFGVMMGKQIAKHWILQTGITYLKQNVDYESNIAASSTSGLIAFDLNAAQAGTGANYVVTNPYTLNSMTEYLSLPVTAGYIFLDRKFGLAVNSGVSTDIFLHNTLTDKSGNYADAAGASAAYRTISWSGVTNTELSMYVGGNLKFSLVPRIRYSFSNVMNENYGYQKPFILDLGFRCRYIFK